MWLGSIVLLESALANSCHIAVTSNPPPSPPPPLDTV
jgi:hypothetical protein